MEFIENYTIQNTAIAVARGMNGILDHPGIKYRIEEKEN